MSWFKRTSSSFSIGLGLLLVLASIHAFNDRMVPLKERQSDGLACLLLGAPLMVLGAASRRSLRLQKQQSEQDRLRSVLYGLLQRTQSLTVLQFAIAAHVKGEVAKQFLREQAQVFDAECEVGDRGEVTYRFPSSHFDSLPAALPSAAIVDATLSNTFDVVLYSCPSTRKIAVIKALRELTGMSLVRAKRLTESMPQSIVQDVPRDLAESYIQRLERAGAVAMIDRHFKG